MKLYNFYTESNGVPFLNYEFPGSIMGKAQTLVIVAAIAVGGAIAASLFVLYPDEMVGGTNLDPGNEAGEFSQPYMDESGDTMSGAPQVPEP